MSRVDDALRRAAMDGPSLHAPTPVEPAAVAVDESALSGYSGEQDAGISQRRPSAHVPTQPIAREEASNARPVRPAPPARSQDHTVRYHTSL